MNQTLHEFMSMNFLGGLLFWGQHSIKILILEKKKPENKNSLKEGSSEWTEIAPNYHFWKPINLGRHLLYYMMYFFLFSNDFFFCHQNSHMSIFLGVSIGGDCICSICKY